MKIVVFGQAILHQPVDWAPRLRQITTGADAVICNFEGCLPPACSWPMKTKTVHPAHPDALAMLKGLGVTHLGLANNHAWDFGPAGLIETRRRAEAAGLAVAGAGADAAEAWQAGLRGGVALIAVDAGPTPDWAVAGRGPGVAALRIDRVLELPAEDIDRIRAIAKACGDTARRERRAAIGYDSAAEAARPLGLDLRPGAAPAEVHEAAPDGLDRLAGAVRAARQQARAVVVAIHYHHWAPDWLQAPDWFGTMAARAAEAGADAVVGSGPPWVIAGDPVGRCLIAPSLGNLAFHTRRGKRYDDLGLPVWTGQAAVLEDGVWRLEPFEVARPSAD